jgi:hypothetical protein
VTKREMSSKNIPILSRKYSTILFQKSILVFKNGQKKCPKLERAKES